MLPVPGIVIRGRFFFAIGIIFLICSSCALGVGMVIPHTELNLISGFIESFMRFFSAFNMPWASPILILLIVFGMLANFQRLVFRAPARGLAVAAANGFIPKILARVNKHDVPGNILLMQAVLCSFFSLLFLAMPDLNAGFWILINLSSQSALLVYILIFLSALKLRLKNPRQSHSRLPHPRWHNRNLASSRHRQHRLRASVNAKPDTP